MIRDWQQHSFLCEHLDCLMWSIWRERNNWIFEGTKRTIQELKTSFFYTLFGWTNVSGVLSFNFLSDLCSIDVVFILLSFVCLLLLFSTCPVCFGFSCTCFFYQWSLLLIKYIYIYIYIGLIMEQNAVQNWGCQPTILD